MLLEKYLFTSLFWIVLIWQDIRYTVQYKIRHYNYWAQSALYLKVLFNMKWFIYAMLQPRVFNFFHSDDFRLRFE